MVDEVLERKRTSFGLSIDAIAFGQGEAGFTGVCWRPGIAQETQLFWCLVPILPIIVSTLAAMAQNPACVKFGETHVATAIWCAHGEVYWARYKGREQDGRWTAVDAECVTPPSELAAQLGSGFWDLGKSRHRLGSVRRAHGYTSDQHQSVWVLFPEAQDVTFLLNLLMQKTKAVAAEESGHGYLRDKWHGRNCQVRE